MHSAIHDTFGQIDGDGTQVRRDSQRPRGTSVVAAGVNAADTPSLSPTTRLSLWLPVCLASLSYTSVSAILHLIHFLPYGLCEAGAVPPFSSVITSSPPSCDQHHTRLREETRTLIRHRRTAEEKRNGRFYTNRIHSETSTRTRAFHDRSRDSTKIDSAHAATLNTGARHLIGVPTHGYVRQLSK